MAYHCGTSSPPMLDALSHGLQAAHGEHLEALPVAFLDLKAGRKGPKCHPKPNLCLYRAVLLSRATARVESSCALHLFVGVVHVLNLLSLGHIPQSTFRMHVPGHLEAPSLLATGRDRSHSSPEASAPPLHSESSATLELTTGGAPRLAALRLPIPVALQLQHLRLVLLRKPRGARLSGSAPPVGRARGLHAAQRLRAMQLRAANLALKVAPKLGTRRSVEPGLQGASGLMA